MMRVILLIIISFSCQAQISRSFFIGRGTGTYNPPGEFTALSGSDTFVMSDIPNENMTKELLINYQVPAVGDCPLLVDIHGWDGGSDIDGRFATDALTMLASNGIALLSVGMRGRNDEVDNYRDASGLEVYDVYKSIRHLIDNIAASGQIDEDKIFIYGASGGGGNSLGVAGKFPELCSVIIDWWGMGKYGTYTGDPDSGFTGWYSDNSGYQGAILNAVGGVPLSTGVTDSYYLARDHFRSIGNFKGKIYNYHDSGDPYVSVTHSDHLLTVATANGQNITQYRSTNGTYEHGEADLFIGKYDGVVGLQWVSDVKTLTRQLLPSSGTLHVSGYAVTDDFNVWMKRIRKNSAVQPRSGAYPNQGKSYASTLVYNKVANTYQITPIIPSTSDQFVFADVTTSTGYAMALFSASDVVTLVPKTLTKQPLSLSHSCKLYYNLSDADGFYLDDATKLHTIVDLTGNNNFAWNQTRANRVSLPSNYIDNGIYFMKGLTGTLAVSFDNIALSGTFTVIISIDPDASTVASLSEGLIGRGAGGGSAITLSTFSGKVTAGLATQTTSVSNSTPANSNVGKQVWSFRRDASDNVTATCLNSTSTYSYTLGTAAGSFELRTLGSATSGTKQFAGKIYRVAVYDEDIGSTDVTSILTDWYNN